MTRPRWPLLRVLLTSHLSFVAVLWVAFIALFMVITGIVAAVGEVGGSLLHYAATQAPRWLLFGLGIDVVTTYLRLHLAHGRTRRDFIGETAAYTVVLSGVTAALITFGYLLERGYYALFGWPQTLPGEGLFSAADQYPAILGTFWLTFLLWTVVGVLVGLGFFRSTLLGVATIPLGLAIVAPTVVGSGQLPLIGHALVDRDLTAGVLLAASAGLFLVGIGLSWAIVRDVPMKSKAP